MGELNLLLLAKCVILNITSGNNIFFLFFIRKSLKRVLAEYLLANLLKEHETMGPCVFPPQPVFKPQSQTS